MPTRISHVLTYATIIAMLATACSPSNKNASSNEKAEGKNNAAAVSTANPREIRDRILEKELPCDGDTVEEYDSNSAIRCDEELIINVYKSQVAFDAAVEYHQSQKTAIAGEENWLLISRNNARIERYAAALSLPTP